MEVFQLITDYIKNPNNFIIPLINLVYLLASFIVFLKYKDHEYRIIILTQLSCAITVSAVLLFLATAVSVS